MSVKLLLAAAYVGVTFWFYTSYKSSMVAWLAAAFVLLIALASLSRGRWLIVDEDRPGLLTAFSGIFLLGPIAFLYLLPIVLYEYDVSPMVPDRSWFNAVAQLVDGVVMAAYLWIPYVGYRLIDRAFDCFSQKAARPA